MTRDTLARRLRTAPPEPRERIVLTDPDYLLFEAIDRHGPLPTHYLYECTKHVRHDYENFQYRLTKFYNGDAAGPYLLRPPRQFDSYEARYQHLVYGLAPRAKAALAERGMLARDPAQANGPFVHQLMSACVGASFELGARAHGLRYIPREEILRRRTVTFTTAAANSLAISHVSAEQPLLIPDDLFGLEYPGAGFRFFAVEVDRNTESIDRRQPGQTSFGRKIRAYGDVLRSRSFMARWGVPNLTVLTITTSAARAANLCAAAGRQGEYLGHFAFKAEPSFGAGWRVPRALLQDLLQTPWITPAGLKDIAIP